MTLQKAVEIGETLWHTGFDFWDYFDGTESDGATDFKVSLALLISENVKLKETIKAGI